MRWLGLVILCLFYGFYFGKMLLQRSRGIRTDQMARGEKHGKAFYTELVMKLATYLAVAAEVFSILTAKPEISRVFTEAKIDVKSMNIRTSKKGTATIDTGFIVQGRDELNSIIEKLRQLPGVIDIERTAG